MMEKQDRTKWITQTNPPPLLVNHMTIIFLPARVVWPSAACWLSFDFSPSFTPSFPSLLLLYHLLILQIFSRFIFSLSLPSYCSTITFSLSYYSSPIHLFIPSSSSLLSHWSLLLPLHSGIESTERPGGMSKMMTILGMARGLTMMVLMTSWWW